MRQNSVSVEEVASLTDAELRRDAWSITTNNRQAGGGSVKGLRLAQRRLRAAGVRYYLARGRFADENETPWGSWGIVGDHDWSVTKVTAEELVTGVSLDHCAHKLGDGCAKRGWDRYWRRQ